MYLASYNFIVSCLTGKLDLLHDTNSLQLNVAHNSVLTITLLSQHNERYEKITRVMVDHSTNAGLCSWDGLQKRSLVKKENTIQFAWCDTEEKQIL